MNEFTKITPVSIGLMVDEQQLQSGITGACSFSRGLLYKNQGPFLAIRGPY